MEGFMKKRNAVKVVGAVFAAVCAVCLLIACGGNQQTPQAGATSKFPGEPYVVPLSAAITGTNAAIGEEIVYGTMMAVEEINEAGGINGRELKIEVIDDQNVASEGLNAAKKAIDQLGAEVLLGPDGSNIVLAALPYAAEKNIPLLATGTNWRVTGSGYKNVFRFRPNDNSTAVVISQIVKQKNYQRIGYFYTNEDYGLGALQSLQKLFDAQGQKILAAETCNIGDTDFTSQIMKLKNAKLDVLILFAKETEGAKFLRQAYELGLDVIKYAGSAMASNFVMDLATPEAQEGMYVIIPFVATNPDPQVQAFVKKYNEKYNIPIPINHAATYYDTTHILALVLKKYGTTRDKIIQGMREIAYDGVLTNFKADEFGDMAIQQSLAICKNGVWEFDSYVGD
jgi:branched-chain amino acid transport system substrate-binding protein